MTGHLTGTAKAIEMRRLECEEAIRCLVQSRSIDAKQILRLRRELGDDLASLVVSVAGLQRKARKKLEPDRPAPENPAVWWATEKSLEQASAWQVAQLKATWFDDGLVYDLCCGIGGDAMALARRNVSKPGASPESGLLVAIDSDGLIAQMAAANLQHAGAEHRSRVCCADAATIEIPRDAAVHIDPDRRAGGARKSSPDFYQPSWQTVTSITNKTERAVVKLAPAAEFESTSPASIHLREIHRCWISLCGSVREQSLLSGDAIRGAGLTPGNKSAVALADDGSANWFAPSGDDVNSTAAEVVTKPSSMLVDPDASIRAAGLTDTFARTYGLRLLGKASGFLTSDQPLPAAAARTAVVGNVIWTGSCDDRKLRRELRSRGLYPAVIKVRGTQHDPTILAKRYRTCGEDPVTLWIGRGGDRAFAAITN